MPDAGSSVSIPHRAVDERALRRLLERFEGHSVTLWSRSQLDDRVISAVRSWISHAAKRELGVEVRINPAMDAGAMVCVGDLGRILLDPRALWLDDLTRAVATACEEEGVDDAQGVYQHLRAALAAGAPAPRVEELTDSGMVERLGNGIAMVSGLRDAGSQELVEFDGGTVGIALSLSADRVGVVVLGEEGDVREGCGVRRLGKPLEVPVGPALLGRVLDPLGRPIDGLGPVVPEGWVPAERPAPTVVERSPVEVPMLTGQKAIDALVPIGRGQRELIIGDRKVGKTTLAVDALLAQRETGVIGIYCAIGQKATSVQQVLDVLRKGDVIGRTVAVVALPNDPPGLRYLAPFTACAIGEYFRDAGRDALVVYDDLSKHAATYREMSALLERPVGREAYPGDIFYLHARLLERAAHLSVERGGGSLTALPIAETLAGDISAFIPTNVISICDGQIVLDSAAFNEGRRPALDPGFSVSRVGGSAQPKVMKKIAGRLRIDLAQYEEMAQFVKFGAEVDASTRAQLQRGERARALLVQEAHEPMSAAHEAVALFAAVSGALDGVPVEQLPEMEEALLADISTRSAELLEELATAEDLTPELEARLDREVRDSIARLAPKPQTDQEAEEEHEEEHEAVTVSAEAG